MLTTLKHFKGYTVKAKNGVIGEVKDICFDDRHWIIRHFVIDTGTWLPGRQLLLSPAVLAQPNWSSRFFTIVLTKEQVKNSAGRDRKKLDDHKHKGTVDSNYKWPTYWTDSPLPGDISIHNLPLKSEPDPAETKAVFYLRSMEEVIGYAIHTLDGEIGQAEDFVLEYTTWKINWVVTVTDKWLFGRKILIPTQWIDNVSSTDLKVYLSLENDFIKICPEYNLPKLANREYEKWLNMFLSGCSR